MSGLAMPPAQPPAPDVDELMARLRIARDSLEVSELRVDKVRQWSAEPDLDWPEETKLRILLEARQLEAELWGREVHELTQRGRAIGLDL